MGQRHFTVAPRQHSGQPQHRRAGFPGLLQGNRVGGDQEVLILPLGENLIGQHLRQAPAKSLPGDDALIPAPGDERGHAMHQQGRPAFAEIAIGVGILGAQLGQRVVPLAEPVPQHRRGDPGRLISAAAALGELTSLPER